MLLLRGQYHVKGVTCPVDVSHLQPKHNRQQTVSPPLCLTLAGAVLCYLPYLPINRDDRVCVMHHQTAQRLKPPGLVAGALGVVGVAHALQVGSRRVRLAGHPVAAQNLPGHIAASHRSIRHSVSPARHTGTLFQGKGRCLWCVQAPPALVLMGRPWPSPFIARTCTRDPVILVAPCLA